MIGQRYKTHFKLFFYIYSIYKMDIYIYVFDYFYSKARKALLREDLKEYEANMEKLKFYSIQYHFEFSPRSETNQQWKIYTQKNPKYYSSKLHEKLVNEEYDYYFEDDYQLDERNTCRIKIPIFKSYKDTILALEIFINAERELLNYNEKRHIKKREQTQTIPFFNSDLTIFFD